MRHSRSASLRWLRGVALAGMWGIQALAQAAGAHADATAYLLNVTVRPGYNFSGPEDALSYGYGLCDAVSQGRAYGQIVQQVKSDFTTSDEYQASYLVTQAVNELCPARIWQLRNSAAHYQPPSDAT